MYYKINPKKFMRLLIIIYLLVIGIVLSKGLSKEKNIEIFVGLKEPIITQEIEIIEVDKIVEVEKDNIVAPFEMVEIGEFNVSGFTKEDRSSKEIMRDYEGVSIAADPEVIPYGTKVWIEGIGIRQVQPNTQNIKGNVIKLYFDTVEEKEAFGEKDINIYKVID